ncbi:argininosuccinate synthase [Planctomycetota bacterium]
MKDKVKKIVLAYSGGLDTSVILPWLKEKYQCDVIAFAAELGQGSELKGVKKKALDSGASKCIVADLRREFLEDYVWPMLKSGAIYENGYLLGTSIGRPLIAKEQVRVAHEEGADAVAHGCTGKGNDQIRFELTYMALDPKLKIISPWKDPTFELTSREAAVDYARKHNIPIDQTKKRIYSRDRNIWHMSHEGADLESSWNEPAESIFVMSRPLSKTPNKAEYVELEFSRGTPVKINGRKIPAVKLMEQLNELGGRHGVGQIDIVESRVLGMKSRGVYETPGGTVLYTAHQALEMICLERETLNFKQLAAQRYADLIYEGRWFVPLRESLQEFFEATQQTVTGKVRLKLYKGNCIMAGVKSPHSLYSSEMASFTMGDEYDSTDATGFIRLFGLPLKMRAIKKK